MERGYPFGIDPDDLVDLVATCWRAHDGQWFLKTAADVGLERAMEWNERAIASVGRIEIRELRGLTGRESFDTVEEMADLYRLHRFMFGGARHIEQTRTVLDPDTLLVENAQCLGEGAADKSGYGHLSPGGYPPCGGWLARQRAWGGAVSASYRFTMERCPEDGRPCRYVVRRTRR